MKKRTRRIISLLLSLALMLSMLPVSAFAAEAQETAEELESTVEPVNETETVEESLEEATYSDETTEFPTEETPSAEPETPSDEEMTEPEAPEETPAMEKDTADEEEVSEERHDMPTLFASASSYAPYANIEYSYSSSVTCGTVRYISQVSSGSHFYSNYWGSWASQANIECGTASISMALSYIGVNKTPQNILDEGNGLTYFGWNWGGSTYSSPSLSTGISNYLNGNGKYSPVVIHIPKYSSAGHYVVIVGQISSNKYQILDPWENTVTSMTISGTTATYTKSGSTITDTIDQVHQWYNANASTSTDITISGANSPSSITQGSTFSITGTVTSGANLTNVTAGCYDVDGNMKTGKSANPGSTSYNIKNLDSGVYFNNLAAGVYYYRVTATNSGGTKTLVNAVFVVLSTGRTVDDGTYTFDSVTNNNYAFNVAYDGEDGNANVQLYEKSESNVSKDFYVTYESNGYYFIRNAKTGKNLDVATAGTTNGTNIQVYTPNSSDAQRWQILPAGNSYCLVSKCGTAMCADITGGTISNATNIELYRANLASAQRLTLTSSKNTYHTGNHISFDANGGTLEQVKASWSINGYNTGRGPQDLIIYNVSGSVVPTNIYGREVAVDSSGCVSAVREYGSETQLTVPSGGFIVSGHSDYDSGGVEFTNQVSAGNYVGYDTDTDTVYAYDTANGYLANHKYVTNNATYGVLPTPTRNGYIFTGWYTSASGGTKVTQNSTYAQNTLYAHWIKEEDATPVATTTYNNHYYELFDCYMSWTAAQAFCEARGGHLVTITSAEENNAVAAMVTKYGESCWIGANDIEEEGTFVWVTGEPFSYTNWDSGEPNNGLNGQDCAQMYATGFWDDVGIENNRSFICEYNLTDLKDCTITLSASSYTYNGSAKTPSVTVRDGSTVLTKDVDYTVTYSDNINAGTATVTITGIGGYTGEVVKTFTIKKATQTITVSSEDLELTIGEQVDLNASAIGALSYVCDDGDVAEVSYDGKVTGVGVGTATVTVTAAETGNYSEASKAITVTVVAEQAEENPFTDVSESSYYYDAVLWAYTNGITTGRTVDGKVYFMPTDSCTRAQAVTFLWRAAGQPEPSTKTNPFSDISTSSYYYKAVLWAYENGITTGKNPGSGSLLFAPNDTCTRAQIVTFLWRAEGKPGHTTSNPFTDVANGGTFTDAILWAYENGITTGRTQGDGSVIFMPDDYCTRAQIVTFLYRDMVE